MAIGYLHYMCSGIACYYEICRKTHIFGERISWICPCHLPTLMMKAFNYIESWRNSITYVKCMWNMCICIGMPYLCSIHIIVAHTSTNKENASPSMPIYIFIYILYIIWLQWHSKHICAWMFCYSIWLWHMQQPCCLYHKELLRHQYPLEDCFFLIHIYIYTYTAYL